MWEYKDIKPQAIKCTSEFYYCERMNETLFLQSGNVCSGRNGRSYGKEKNNLLSQKSAPLKNGDFV